MPFCLSDRASNAPSDGRNLLRLISRQRADIMKHRVRLNSPVAGQFFVIARRRSAHSMKL
jgi:hypothetical protein